MTESSRKSVSVLSRLLTIASLLIVLIASDARAAEKKRFLGVVRGYADAMIDVACDEYGPQEGGLLFSAFDRMEMKPLTTRPASPGGVRRGDRSGPPWEALTGANPHLDENLLRVLYLLTEITNKPRYAEAADREIEWFLNHAQSPVTHLLAWGEHLSWEVMRDKPTSGGDDGMHEFARPWVLWDRSYALAPEACKRFALGLWEHQVADHRTGGFDRHAPFDKHGPVDGKDFPRHAGFYIATWAYAYKYTQDPVFLNAIETLLARFERKRQTPQGPVATIGPLDPATAATLVPEPLASRLRAFCEKEDELILASWRETYGQPDRSMKLRPDWQAGYSTGVVAGLAMFSLARYEQVGKPEFRDMIVAVADAYLNTRPDEDVDVWPMTFGHIISTQVAAGRFTSNPAYLEQAETFAQMAVDIFWQDKPLPRASFKTGHYEAITGADSLALALLEVHAALNGLKVAIPSNSIDR